MAFHFNAFSITLVMSGVAALLISLLIFQRMGGAIRWFSMMMLCISIWAIAYGFELSVSTLPEMLFWINIEYIGISFLPTTWIVFVIKFIGKNKWLTLKNRIIIFAFPIIALLLVWTNQWHHIHYEQVSLNTSGPFPLLAIKPGPWYYIHTVYFYFMLAWGIYLLIKVQKTDPIYRKQNIAIITGALIPWLVNFIYLLGLRPYQHIDLTPYAFIATSIIISFGLLRYSLFDIVPVAREKVIEEMREGMIVLDSSHRVIDLNKGMKDFLQLQSNPIGRHITDIFPEQFNLYKALNNKKVDSLDIRLKNNNGVRFFEINLTPILEKDTIHAGSTLILWDITERKVAEELLILQAHQLQILNQMKDKIFSIISHDLRSPLASLIGILDMAHNKDISDEELKLFLSELSKDVGYTSNLVENLLHWSKSQLKGESVQPEYFDVKGIIQNKLLMFEKTANEKNIAINDETFEHTMIYADKSMIKSVLRNLISNAIKFCSDGDQITISATIEKDFTTICVSDTGLGIREGDIQKLFSAETFTLRGTNNEKGTGLGLIICNDFIKANNGSISVESTFGEGSKFCFTLPNKANNQ
jgi:PAS domain S-box-containing protein